MKCLRCGSEDVVTGARVADQTYMAKVDLQVQVVEDPGALIFRARTETLTADICADCGFAMLGVSPAAAKRLKKARAKASTRTKPRR